MWRHEYKKPETPSDEEAAAAIREYFDIKESEEVSDKRLKELRGKILAYMDSQKLDRVFGGSGYITKITQERATFDEDMIKPILEKLNLWEKALAPDSKKLQLLIKSLPEDAQEEALAAKKTSSFVVLKASKK